MASERFATLSDEEMDVEQRRVARALIEGPRKGIRGPFPALLRRPQLADAVRALGDCVRYTNSLPPRISEFAISLVVWHWNVPSEWTVHGRLATESGLDPAILEAVAAGRAPEMGAPERTIYRACQEILLDRSLSDETFDAVRNLLGEAGAVDLIGAIAYYNFVCTTLSAVYAPSGDDAPPLPRIA